MSHQKFKLKKKKKIMVSDMIDKCIFPDYLLTVVGAMLGLGSAVFILTANIYCAFLKPNNCPQLT